MADMVNHPDHYKANGLEVIDIIEKFGLGFHLGNAVKYILRAGVKTEDPVDDLEKAIWYINRALDNVEYKITDKGKAVVELREAGIEVPFVKNIGFRYEDGRTRTLQDNGLWANEDGWVVDTESIIRLVKEGYGGVVDLDEPEKEEESNLRQQAIEEIRQAGHFVPEGERLFYVNPSGSAWKLNDNGKWVGSLNSLSTEDVKRYLVCDGADVRGTIRTSDHGFRALREVLNFPEVGDRIEDVDGDVWEFNGLSWIFEDLKKSTEQVRQYHGPISLPDEEV